MDLVSMDDKSRTPNSRSASIFSTLQFRTSERDYSAFAAHREQHDDVNTDSHWRALVAAAAEHLEQHRQDVVVSVADEMDLVQAAERRHLYDKILLLLNHGETFHQILDDEIVKNKGEDEEEEIITDALTGRGIGQALTLSRRTATFCNGDTGLVPDLFVLEPSRKAVQTAFFGFPYDTPHSSLRRTLWICHPGATGSIEDAAPTSELEREFLGIDCSLCSDDKQDIAASSTDGLLAHTEDLVTWLHERDERIIVGMCDYF
jgi:hypothetical protein